MLRHLALFTLPLALVAACSPDGGDAPSAPHVAQAAAAGDGSDAFSYAIIGDRPYGDAKLAEMPSLIAQINADPAISLVMHLGDIEDRDPTLYGPVGQWLLAHLPSSVAAVLGDGERRPGTQLANVVLNGEIARPKL